MKKLILVSLVLALSASPAFADRGFTRGGGHGGWRWGGAWIIPALIGGAILYDVTRPRPVYIDPAPVYVQSGPVYAPVVAQSAQPWYFCPAANGYYPYIPLCPTGWQAVPATPPGVIAGGPSGVPPPPR